MAHDVFISYSHKDKAITDAICNSLENNEIRCWVAPRDIDPGANWATSIAAAIPKSKVFLLIFSSHSNLSQQVLREVELAISNKLIVVPVRIEDTLPTAGMSYYLSTVHWLDIIDGNVENNLKALSKRVKNILESECEHDLTPTINLQNRRKRRSWIWIAVSIFLLLSISSLIIFRESILEAFTNRENSTPKPSLSLTPKPTPSTTATANPSPSPTIEAIPTATVDPDAPLDTVVDIPDLGLRSCIYKTLDNMGEHVIGNITVSDMLKLEDLVIISLNERDNYLDIYEGYMPVVSDAKIVTLEGLQYARNLKSLLISDQNISDISALSQIYHLERIILRQNSITDISALSNQGYLRTLNLSGNNVTDIYPLIMLYNLEGVDISENPVSDLTPLSGLISLTSLEMDGAKLHDLAPLSNLLNLRFLTVSGNNIEDFYDLGNLSKLEAIHFFRCSNINSITSLVYLENLREVGLSNNNIQDVDALFKLDRLETVLIDQATYNKFEDNMDKLKKQGCEIIIFD